MKNRRERINKRGRRGKCGKWREPETGERSGTSSGIAHFDERIKRREKRWRPDKFPGARTEDAPSRGSSGGEAAVASGPLDPRRPRGNYAGAGDSRPESVSFGFFCFFYFTGEGSRLFVRVPETEEPSSAVAGGGDRERSPPQSQSSITLQGISCF